MLALTPGGVVWNLIYSSTDSPKLGTGLYRQRQIMTAHSRQKVQTGTNGGSLIHLIKDLPALSPVVPFTRFILPIERTCNTCEDTKHLICQLHPLKETRMLCPTDWPKFSPIH